MQGLPIPKDAHGQAAMHSTHVDRALATWADDASLRQAFLASVVHPVVQVLAPDCAPLVLTDGCRKYLTALLTH
jgi:hypothetical protein